MRWLAAALLLALLGCTTGPGPPCDATARGDEVIYVVDHGWHTDLGMPARELSGPLAAFRTVFPGARAFIFGFGKRTFFTASVDTWREYLLGPFPGPAAILVTGLKVMPDAAYGADATIILHLPSDGSKTLSTLLWKQFVQDSAGRPRLIAPGLYPGSLFYAATETYSLDNTCNAWTARALQVAGVAITPSGVIFAGQVMRRARRAALCPIQGVGTNEAVSAH